MDGGSEKENKRKSSVFRPYQKSICAKENKINTRKEAWGKLSPKQVVKFTLQFSELV